MCNFYSNINEVNTMDKKLILENKKRKELLERRLERLEKLIREDMDNERQKRNESLVRRYRNR